MRKIIQIAIGSAAAWNGLPGGEEHYVVDRDALYALDNEGRVWMLNGDPHNAPVDRLKWVALPALPTPPAT